jgi:hypothetical protein
MGGRRLPAFGLDEADRLEGLRDAPHWSSRGMAQVSGISTSSVQRICHAFGQQPHRLETFKLSADPNFVSKVHDVVGIASFALRRIPGGRQAVGIFKAAETEYSPTMRQAGHG